MSDDAGVTAAVAGTPDQAVPDEQRWDAVVVGAGLGGLVAARDLARAGLRVLVLDGRDAPGGAVRSHEVAGLRLDAGAESFATRGGAVAALVGELGMADDLCTPAPRGSWVHLVTGDGPLPATGLLGIPTDPGAADVRRTLGALGSWRARLDGLLPARVGADATTLGALVRSRMGARVLDRLVRPLVGGVHAADPDQLAVDVVAPGLRAALAQHGTLGKAVGALRAAAPAGSAVQGLSGGVWRLVDALVADVRAHGGEVRVRSAVTGLAVDDDRSGAGAAVGAGVDSVRGFVVRTANEDVHTDRVLLATPAAVPLVAELTGADPGTMRTDDGTPVTLVTLVLDGVTALDAAPRGTGVLVAPDVTDVTAKALTHATAKWEWLAAAAGPGRHVLRLSFGRAEDDAAALPAGDDLVRLALADAAVLLGVPLPAERLVGHDVVRWTQALPRPSASHRDAVAAVRDAVARVPGLALTGAWVSGNGLASVVPQARSAAAELLTALAPRG
ncbi:FAD-dependent oxidoreductase [Cellulomonas sp. 73-145]|uniref:protoporphyrinogen/coproporphyrinogen oxidase n=1 Tax=Cellulomonas sp. 73-145 TaxID=1895739 RepID=UPI000B17B4F6